jgi:hypothetical protein
MHVHKIARLGITSSSAMHRSADVAVVGTAT